MFYLWRFNLPGVEPVFCDPLVQPLVVVHVVNVVLHHAADLHAVVARHKQCSGSMTFRCGSGSADMSF
jgi:hypothetical protein